MADQITLLHVDDDPDFLEVSSRLFQEGFETLTAPSAEDGLRLLETHEVDCIVSDFVISTDGTPFISAARDVAADVPIILFTGKEWGAVAADAVAANVTEYVQKSGVEEIEVVKHRISSLVDGDQLGVSQVDPDRLQLVPAVSQTTSLSVSATGLGDAWHIVGQHDWESVEELGTTIVEAIEGFTGEDAEAFTPLFESVDADALEELLRPMECEDRRGVQVRFPYKGYELAVTSNGDIAVRSLF